MDDAQRWARGAYYTPSDAAHFIATWALRGIGERFLEPSFGDGAFIRAVADVAAARGWERPTWIASELNAAVAASAVRDGLLRKEELHVGDFLERDVSPVDAVIANPPYVRLRHLAQKDRNLALRRAEEALGTGMSPSGSLWMPFVIHMVSHLKHGGRAAMVLPLDFTYVAYARPLWDFLASRFGSLRVLRTRQRVFADLNQDVMIVLADEHGGSTASLSYEAYERVDDLVAGTNAIGGAVSLRDIAAGERPFQQALLPDGLADLLNAVEDRFVRAGQLATFRIGYVAGDKRFFHPTQPTIDSLPLPRRSLKRTLTNSRRLRGRGLRSGLMGTDDTDFLWTPGDELTEGEKRYVELGESLGVHQGYKARMRKQWFRVPGVAPPDVVLSVFSERPLLVVNDAHFLASNSLLGGYVHDANIEGFAAAWYTPLTLLSIGLQVHSLGGGVMIMVPNEASRVRIPLPEIAHRDLAGTHAALMAGDMRSAYAEGDKVAEQIVGKTGLKLVYQGIERLSYWR
ncbi:N-6 DNA methylase [Curtobacterium flaccumfaciens]|uniref:N-6 DNA methylase n=1 Tax=Curtobacterium flaccumfaciens TaxID=2035 RepID=UPI001375E342|nr:N-6 DNA methylase [Curtobacterium flaccumfaciens]